MIRIRLIHWKEEFGREHASQLRSAGYQIDFDVFNPAVSKDIREDPPAAIIIDLTRAPSQGRDLGLAFRKYKDTRTVPLIFAGGAQDKIDQIRQLLPDATFTNWHSIENAIQNVEFPGDEESVLGPYMPVFQYMSKEEFEALGRNPGDSLP